MSIKLIKDLKEELEWHKGTEREAGLKRIITELENFRKAIIVLRIYGDPANYITEDNIDGESITFNKLDDGEMAREFLISIGETL